MKVLTTSTSNQTLTFVPKAFPSTVILTVRDTSTNTTTRTNSVTLTRTNDKASITHAFTLIEGRFYDINILQGIGANWNAFTTKWEAVTDNWESIISTEKSVYLDKVFCTDQEIDQLENKYYSINSGEYTETTSYPSDDYIIIS